MKRLSIVLSSLFLLGTALAQQDMSVDEALLRTSLQADAYEILSSEMALERSENEDIREFAQAMIDAHTESSDELRQMSDDAGYQIDFLASPAQGVLLAHLSQLEGPEFDQEYLVQQMLIHQNALIILRTGAGEAENEDLQRFASQASGDVAGHLSRVQELMRTHGFTDPFGPEALAAMSTEVQETGDPADADQPQEDQPQEDQPADDQPQDDQPADDQPQDDQPEEEQPEGSDNAEDAG